MTRNCNHDSPYTGPNRARRWFLQQCGVGLGAAALTQLLGPAKAAEAAVNDPLAVKQAPFRAQG